MRILAGRLRGKKLATPEGLETRPYPDRLRKSLFQIIENHWGIPLGVDTVLDLYAGSGSLGLEAVSRGANKAVFVENGTKALGALKTNLAGFQTVLGNGVEMKIIADSVESALQRLKAGATTFKLILADPPYQKNRVGAVVEGAWPLVEAGGWLAVRHHEAELIGDPPAALRLRDERKNGFHIVTIFERPQT